MGYIRGSKDTPIACFSMEILCGDGIVEKVSYAILQTSPSRTAFLTASVLPETDSFR